MGRRIDKLLNFLTEPLIVGVMLALAGVVLVVLNLRDLRALVEGFGSQLIGIAFTIIVIDRIYDLRTRRERKLQLIRQMGSKDNGLALFAVTELKVEGWLEDGSLREVNLSYSNLEDAKMDKADFRRTTFGEANLRKAGLGGANLERGSLPFADLTAASLNDTNCRQASMYGVNLYGSSMYRTNFEAANLTGANFEMARLVEADLQKAQLNRAKFIAAILENTNLQDADLSEADLNGANLQGANLQGANLTEVSIGDLTDLPDGSKWSPNEDLSRFTNPEHPKFWRSDKSESPAYKH